VRLEKYNAANGPKAQGGATEPSSPVWPVKEQSEAHYKDHERSDTPPGVALPATRPHTDADPHQLIKGQLWNCPYFEAQFLVCPYYLNFARLPLFFQNEASVCPSFLHPLVGETFMPKNFFEKK
jgi:hypothetical protein